MEQRLIDANKLQRWLKMNMANTNPLHCDIRETYSECITMVNVMETVDAVPVVHGRWSEPFIGGYDGLHAVYYMTCSKCMAEVRHDSFRFCPNCGAKMDGGAADGN